MKLYTRTGDDGTTGLFDRSRVRKDDVRVESYAAIDELNSILGWAAAAADAAELMEQVRQVQQDLFVIGAALAASADSKPAKPTSQLQADSIGRLESWIDQAWSELPELKQFVLPGGNEAAARMHLARAACRRAERRVVGLAARQQVPESILAYLNRLGDLLFAWARSLNNRAGEDELLWIPD